MVILSLIFITIFFTDSAGSIISLIPMLSLFVVSAVRLIPSFNSISTSLAGIKSYRPSYKLVYSNLINKQNITKSDYIDEVDDDLKFKNKIIIKNVYFSYEDKKVFTLNNINFEILKGSNLGIIGKSGSGKSTLVSLLIGLLEPDKGEISTDNINIRNKAVIN